MAGHDGLIAVPTAGDGDVVAVLRALGAATDVSLDLPGDLSYERWEALGVALSVAQRRVAWLIADWLNYGEHAYGAKYDQAVELTGYSLGTLRNYAWTGHRVPPENRVVGVPFSAHTEVAPLPPSEQKEWLEKAAENGWKRDELRANVRAVRIERGNGEVVTPALQPSLEQAARDLIASARPSGDDYLVRRASFVDLRRALAENG